MSEANVEGNAGAPGLVEREPRHFRRAVITWVVVSIVGIIIWSFVASYILPTRASNLDETNDFTMYVFAALAIPVAAFVFVFLGYSLIFFRTKERPTEDAVPLKPRPGLQIGWLGITGLLCLFLFIWGLVAFYQESTAAPTSGTVFVQVTAQQWQWTFNYPQSGATSQGAQLIELPVNRPVQFFVTSKDVLHGFAVRSLGIFADANPGETVTTAVVTPTVIGSYTVNCMEMCGTLHAYMWEQVKVVDQATFDSWIASQGGHP